jgi:DNA-binding NarL/FixJ family response regulator
VTIRILLADSHASMRESLRALIERQPDMQVVAEAENGHALLQLSGSFTPDVVIMDTQMPDLKGVDAARQMVSGAPEIRILVLSMHASRQFADEMIKAGFPCTPAGSLPTR